MEEEPNLSSAPASAQNRMRNFVLLGAIGSGKSTTGNLFIQTAQNLKEHPIFFDESDAIASCTTNLQEAALKEFGVRIIDTPGFGETRFSENKIDRIMKKLTNFVVDFSGKSTNCIDAFILVIKLAPRPLTLKSDLDHLRNIFGSIAAKSLILLVIDTNPKPRNPETIYTAFERDASEAIKLMKEQRPGTNVRDWTLCWDNIKPRETQFVELLKLTQNLEPYTHQKFLEAQKEIKGRIVERIKEEIKRQRQILEKDYRNNKAELQRKNDELLQKHAQEKEKNEEARQRAEKETKELITGLMENNAKTIESLMKEQKEQKDRELEKLSVQLKEAQKDNKEMFAQFVKMQMEQAEERSKVQDMSKEIQKLREEIAKRVESDTNENVKTNSAKEQDFDKIVFGVLTLTTAIIVEVIRRLMK